MCGSALTVQRYGGGLRYHCPKCDVREFMGRLTAYWTNSAPPENRKCNNLKGRKVFKNTKELR